MSSDETVRNLENIGSNFSETTLRGSANTEARKRQQNFEFAVRLCLPELRRGIKGMPEQ